MSPLFTVATISFNSGKWIRQTIESILASSFTDFEFLISDDCSTDDTWAIIKEYDDLRIKAWRNEWNIGEYPNRNAILKKATGRYIIYIDGDDILYNASLRNLSEYISIFPEAGMLWGIPIYDFIIYPVEFSPEQIFRIEFLGNYNWSMIGFPETVFKTELLKQVGGFSEKYAIGDNYIKKKIALNTNVLLIPIGTAFWRVRVGQASQNVGENYRSLLEQYEIDRNILKEVAFPLSKIDRKDAHDRLMRRTVIQILRNTIFKCKIGDFITLKKKTKISYVDFFRMFKKVRPNTKLGRSGEDPLVNKYNFKKQ